MPLTNPASPTAPPAPATPPPAPEPRAYPRLLYQYSDAAPGFIYLKVESAEQETKVLAGDQTAIAEAKQAQQQPPDAKGAKPPAAPDGAKAEAVIDDKGWYDTPDEARYARARAHLPYVEFGRDIGAPITWPAGMTEGMKATAAAVAARLQPPPAPATEAAPYPKLKYQAIEEAPGFKYVKMTSPDDESALAGSGSGAWYDTPAEAISNAPAPQPSAAGQRPTQTGFGSHAGPAAPEGAGGPSVPEPHNKDKDAKTTNGGKHKP